MAGQTPHDALFKFTFMDPLRAADEFREVLPKSLGSKIDWASFATSEGSFVDDELVASHSDLLFKANISGKPALIYLLFEHQSNVDPLMSFRLLKYVVRILDGHVREAKESLPLPAVIPLLLHHSRTGWNAATSMHGLFDQSLVQDPEIAPFLPQLNFIVDDVSKLSDQEIRGRAAELFVKVVLWLMRDARDEEHFIRSLPTWASALDELSQQPSGEDALKCVLKYISFVSNVPRRDIIDIISKHSPITETAIMTLAEQWIEEGVQRGREEGVQRGREEGVQRGREEGVQRGREEGQISGRVQGRAETLLDLVAMKFGTVSAVVRAQILAGSEHELARWTAAILRANSIDDLFAV